MNATVSQMQANWFERYQTARAIIERKDKGK